MIQISPAILTDNLDEFIRQLNIYKQLTTQVDIDINIPHDSFAGQPTLPLETIANYLDSSKITFGIHLMVSEPWVEVEKLVKLLKPTQRLIYYIHQEANFQQVLDHRFEVMGEIAVAVKSESHLREVEFYKQFTEVQLMTINTGQQGNAFEPEILKRTEELRAQGYQGKISIDGGVSLENASQIKVYPIDRVSVGSYLSHSKTPLQSFAELNKELNL